MSNSDTRYFALVPAAGVGSRMAAGQPKQYLPLMGKPLLFHTLKVLCNAPQIKQVFVVLSVDDVYWKRYDWKPLGERLTPLFCGGPNRADSVLAGLRAIVPYVSPTDWILVHDAARPCLASWHIDQLIKQLGHDEVGGILAVPVADTLKQADKRGCIAATIPRDSLWRAQTPQMFRYVMLRRALESRHDVSDEASAIEAAGLRPKLVQGDITNLKVTWPLDLHLAEWILQNRNGEMK